MLLRRFPRFVEFALLGATLAAVADAAEAFHSVLARAATVDRFRIVNGKTNDLAPMFKAVESGWLADLRKTQWHWVVGKVSQVTEDGVLVLLDEKWGSAARRDFTQVFIWNHPLRARLVDGNPVSVLAIRAEPYRYKTVLGATRTVDSFDYGKGASKEYTQEVERREQEDEKRREAEQDRLRAEMKAKADAAAEKKRIEIEARVVEALLKRARAGSDTAQFDLGVRLLEGRGIERNTDEAVKWLRAAEAQGNAQAAMKLKELKP